MIFVSLCFVAGLLVGYVTERAVRRHRRPRPSSFDPDF
jgi:hypothetical protein